MSLKVLVLVGVVLSVCAVCLEAAPQAEKYEAVSSTCHSGVAGGELPRDVVARCVP